MGVWESLFGEPRHARVLRVAKDFACTFFTAELPSLVCKAALAVPKGAIPPSTDTSRLARAWVLLSCFAVDYTFSCREREDPTLGPLRAAFNRELASHIGDFGVSPGQWVRASVLMAEALHADGLLGVGTVFACLAVEAESSEDPVLIEIGAQHWHRFSQMARDVMQTAAQGQ